MQPEPFERGTVIEAGLFGIAQAQRGDAGPRFLFAERERIVGTEHHAFGEQEPGAGIAALDLSAADQARLYNGTALEWLGLHASRFDTTRS